ncbi:hypothetical protein K438DRAFT_1978364 [Mycena galopus ATCC 62051]|nr:hypothetical protein K438DRAFT_1978364 [Mycena galopus ATCC 62051]
MEQTILRWHPSAHIEHCKLIWVSVPNNSEGSSPAPHQAKPRPKKIKLFDRDDDDDAPAIKQERVIIQHNARFHLMMKQQKAIEKAAGYDRVLAYIALFGDIVDPEECFRARVHACTLSLTHHVRQREATYKKLNQARRDTMDAESAAYRERLLASAPPLRKIKLIPSQGKREVREHALTEDDLYKTLVRPDLIRYPHIPHVCHICLNAKSHPVVMKCGHSACYVCLRLSLETNRGCPECGEAVTCKPAPHHPEAAEIERDHGEWDASDVKYAWDGLVFPCKHAAEYRLD